VHAHIPHTAYQYCVRRRSAQECPGARGLCRSQVLCPCGGSPCRLPSACVGAQQHGASGVRSYVFVVKSVRPQGSAVEYEYVPVSGSFGIRGIRIQVVGLRSLTQDK
jgi:hypothetical protein